MTDRPTLGNGRPVEITTAEAFLPPFAMSIAEIEHGPRRAVAA